MQRPWVRWAGRVGVLLSFVLMAGVLWSSAGQLRGLEWKRFLVPGLVGLVVYGLSLALQGLVWVALVAQLSGVPWGWWDIQVYCATHFTRRIPGAPWYMAGRALMYRDKGRGGQAALTASLVEWGGILITAGIWLAADRWRLWGWLGTAAALVIIMLAWPLLARIQKMPGWFLPLVNLPRWWVIMLGAAYTVAWILGGIILALLIQAAASGATIGFMKVMVVWAVGGGVSLLAVMAPAGLGIRELSLTVLLQPYFGAGLSLVIAVILRVLFTLGDIVWGGLFWIMSHRLSRS